MEKMSYSEFVELRNREKMLLDEYAQAWKETPLKRKKLARLARQLQETENAIINSQFYR